MDFEYLKLLDQAVKFASDEYQEKNQCDHEEVAEENGKKTCMECGMLLEENFIINFTSNILIMKKRKKTESTIYNDIPSFIEQNIKDLTFEIFKLVTTNKISRNTLKKAIVLASLHRASALVGNHISYYDLLDMFGLKQHEANRGFAILASNIPKKSKYNLKFNQEKEELVSIHSKLRKIGLATPEMINCVVNVFNLLKEKRSNIINTSHPNSIICGCIYFWVVYTDNDKDNFAKLMEISKMTLMKVYTAVCDTVFNSVMKDFFVVLLQNAITQQIEGPVKYKNVFKKRENVLYGPKYKNIIYNPFDCNEIYATPNTKKGSEEIRLPLDDVDDTEDWNLLLSEQYHTAAHIYMLNVKLMKKNEKELYFDFNDYNQINKKSGLKLFQNLLQKKFNHKPISTEEEESIDIKTPPLQNLKKKIPLPV